MTDDDCLFDDLFHQAAFRAYVEEACLSGGPPDSEATRQRAYRLYEEALATRRTSVGDPK